MRYAGNLPPINNHQWRAMRLDDAAALAQLEMACAPIDGATHLLTQADWRVRLVDEVITAVNSIIAINHDGHIAAAVIQVGQHQSLCPIGDSLFGLGLLGAQSLTTG